MVSKCPMCGSRNISRIKSKEHKGWMFEDRSSKLMQGWMDDDKHYVCNDCGKHFRNAFG